jgi:hypothetical protein
MTTSLKASRLSYNLGVLEKKEIDEVNSDILFFSAPASFDVASVEPTKSLCSSIRNPSTGSAGANA